ncbi:MAG: dihydrofolate reductase family protein [Candidatus Omnitrophica bacterium]|nr:dihydrofolate reductase family protein [Candidatus Omnitrophota bacterium]
MSVFVEGGSETVANFFEEKLVDKVYFFIAPKILGGRKSLASVGGNGLPLKESPFISKMEIKKIGQDILVEGYPDYGR